jgi:hypothetical protein
VKVAGEFPRRISQKMHWSDNYLTDSYLARTEVAMAQLAWFIQANSTVAQPAARLASIAIRKCRASAIPTFGRSEA